MISLPFILSRRWGRLGPALCALVSMPLSGFCDPVLVIDAASHEYRIAEAAGGEIAQPLAVTGPKGHLLEFLPQGGREGRGGLRCAAPGTARPIQIRLDPGSGATEVFNSALPAFTVAGWIKPEVPGNIVILERLPQQAGCFVFGIRIAGGGEGGSTGGEAGQSVVSLGVTQASVPSVAVPFPVGTGTWLHLAATFEHGTVTYYADGEMLGEPQAADVQEIPVMAAPRPVLAVGRGLEGELGDIVWLPGKALNAEEIRNLYGSKGKLEAAIFLKP